MVWFGRNSSRTKYLSISSSPAMLFLRGDERTDRAQATHWRIGKQPNRCDRKASLENFSALVVPFGPQMRRFGANQKPLND
jgi:hypothetical protein